MTPPPQKSKKTLILSAEDVLHLLRFYGRDEVMDRVIAAMHEAFRRLPAGELELPPRSGFYWNQPELGLLEWMPVLERGRSATIKVVAYIPGNPSARALPTVVGTISLYDPIRGHLEALADGVLLTAVRTGAASALATRVLSRPRVETVGLVGCGMQAVTQLHALSRVIAFERVLICDIERALEESFATRAAFLDLPIERAPLEVIERESDVLCTITSVGVGEGPVLRGDELKAHVHVNAVGSDFPGKTEIPRTVLERSLVCPDFREQAVREGECQQLDADEIGPELSEIVSEPERFADWQERSTVFDSTGSALEDHAAMQVVVDMAHEQGIGTWIQLEHLPEDTRDPYGPVAPRAVSVELAGQSS